MKNAFLVILMLFISSCSAVWKSEFLAPAQVAGALDVELFDWETELYGGPSFGHFLPKIYAYKFENGYYFIYPREINRSGTMGPPIIPLGIDRDKIKTNKKILFGFRLLDPTHAYSISPIKMSLFAQNDHQISCDLVQFNEDAVGVEYQCSEDKEFPAAYPTKVLVEFSNSKTIELPLKLVKVEGYSPLFSFNGPNPKPRVIIHEKNGLIVYPN